MIFGSGPSSIRIVVILKLIMLGAYNASPENCNEAVCGSIVTKCLLTKSCSCDFKTQQCSKECFGCLGLLYTQCCSCVDMCPQSPSDISKSLSKNSNVEDFAEPVPELFDVLTEFPDDLKRWDVTVFPIDIDVSQYSTKKEIKLHIKTSKEKDISLKPDVLTLNCTVVFWSQCLSWSKCQNSCLSMGSSSYRWFHDGCCECIGQNCLNYGINKSNCKLCPLADDATEVIEEEDYDYGEYEYEDYEDTGE